MENKLITRYASVVALDAGGAVLAETGGYYRVGFDFLTRIGDSAHECSIRIYNLPEGMEAKIKRGAKAARLIAGSKEKHGEVFFGEVVDAFSVKVDTYSYLQLALMDGDSFYSSYIAASIGAGESLGRVAETCVQSCSSPLEIGYIPAKAYGVKLPRGTVLFGSPADALASVAKSLDAVYYVLKGRFYMIGIQDNPFGGIMYMDQDNGLLSVLTMDQWYASFCNDINSALTIGRLVSFDLKNGGGHYRVASVHGEGDTKDGNWRLLVTAMGQSGSAPSMAAVTNNVWR